MASRIHVLDPDGDALFWGQSAIGPARGADAPAAGDRADRTEDSEETFAPSEPPTVRSARSWIEPHVSVAEPIFAGETGEIPIAPLMTDPMTDASGIVVRQQLEEPIVVDEDEPCPETLRSPVSTGVSTTPRRTRVA